MADFRRPLRVAGGPLGDFGRKGSAIRPVLWPTHCNFLIERRLKDATPLPGPWKAHGAPFVVAATKVSHNMRHIVLAVLMVIMTSAVTAAVAEGPLESRLSAFRVVPASNGETKLETAESAAPGDLIEYHLDYANVSQDPLQGLVINGQIPQGTTYVGQSAFADFNHSLEVSIDGGETWTTEPVIRQVKQADGSVKDEVVPPSEYTQIRWRLQDALQPESELALRYRVSVSE